MPNTQVATQRTHCHFTGRVQGVGFRYTVKNLALCHDVAGYVRNLPDGRVELVVEGPDREIEQLIADVGYKMNGFIKDVSRNTLRRPGSSPTSTSGNDRSECSL